MSAFRWLLTLVLGVGLFTGIAYVLTPLLTDGWGNTTSTVVGIVLIAACGAGLLKLNPRAG
jgi:hypothetical protein